MAAFDNAFNHLRMSEAPIPLDFVNSSLGGKSLQLAEQLFGRCRRWSTLCEKGCQSPFSPYECRGIIKLLGFCKAMDTLNAVRAVGQQMADYLSSALSPS